jgi:hypothetical protein
MAVEEAPEQAATLSRILSPVVAQMANRQRFARPLPIMIGVIQKGDAYCGDANILGKPYVTGYEPIRNAEKNVIGIYFVGYAN